MRNGVAASSAAGIGKQGGIDIRGACRFQIVRHWQEVGVWFPRRGVLVATLRGADCIDFSRAIIDSSSIRAVGAGQKQDRSPQIARDTGARQYLPSPAAAFAGGQGNDRIFHFETDSYPELSAGELIRYISDSIARCRWRAQLRAFLFFCMALESARSFGEFPCVSCDDCR